MFFAAAIFENFSVISFNRVKKIVANLGLDESSFYFKRRENQINAIFLYVNI